MFSFLKQENQKVRKISQLEAKRLMDTRQDMLIIDVRSKEEYHGGHIKGAKHLPVDQIHEKNLSLLPDKNQMILVYCHSGGRSSIAAGKLVKLGYHNVYDFGGVMTWPHQLV